MGFLDRLLGGNKKIQPSSINDGAWLDSYRNSLWKEVLSFSNNNGSQTAEVALDSCYLKGDKSVWCILRSIDNEHSNIVYFCGFIGSGLDSDILLLVDRKEDFNRNVISKDNWGGAGKSLSHREGFDVIKAIKIIKNYASAVSFSTIPPYVMLVLMNSKKT